MSKAKSLTQTIYSSQVFMVFIACVLSGVLLYSLYAIHSISQQISNQLTPLIITNDRLQLAFQKSVVSSNQWLHLKDDKIRKQRQLNWKNQILPLNDELAQRSSGLSIAGILPQVQAKLNQSYNWQWRIEQSAHMEGNFPVKQHFNENIAPIIQDGLSVSQRLLKYGRKINGSNQGSDYIQAIINTQRILYSLTQTNIERLDNIQINQFHSDIIEALNDLGTISGVTTVTSRYLAQLQKNLTLIQIEFNRLQAMLGGTPDNIAQQWFEQNLMPLANTLILDLEKMHQQVRGLIDERTQRIETLTNRVLVFVGLMLSGLLCYAMATSKQYLYLMTRPLHAVRQAMSKRGISKSNEIESIDEMLYLNDQLKNEVEQKALIIKKNHVQYALTVGEEQWIRDAQISLYKIIYESKTLQALARQVCQLFSSLFSTDICIFYVTNLEQQRLIRYGAYGLAANQRVKPYVDIDGSLVGQAFTRKKMIHFNDLPNSYVKTVGLPPGKEASELLLIPLLLADKVKGVIELPSCSPILTKHKRCAGILSESIVLAIDYSLLSARICQLSESSHAQVDQIKMLEKELSGLKQQMNHHNKQLNE